MDTRPELVVDSVTGVDVALPVAGPGVRSFAFLIDWHIRTILAIAWYVVGAFVYNRARSISAPLSPDATWFVYVVAPPAAIYFLYHTVFEILTRGRTPGKRMAGIQIVTGNGGAPSVGALLTRNVFRLVDSLPVAYAVGLVTTMFTRNNVRVGDLAAGTVLVYADADSKLIFISGGRKFRNDEDATSAEVRSELLTRWEDLDATARQRMARALLAKSHRPAAEAAAVTPHDDTTLRLELERLTAEDAA